MSFTGASDCECVSSGETSLTITITQEAASAVTIFPSTLMFTPKSDFKTIYLTSQNVGSWGVSEITNQGSTWCSVLPTSGIGSDTIVVKVDANIGADRSCDVVFTGVSTAHSTSNSVLHVMQSGPYLEVSPSSVGTLQGTTDFASVNVSCNTVWSASSDAAWCSVTPSVDDVHGNITPNKLLIFVKENSGEQRSCTVTVRTMDGSDIVRTVTVTQAKSEGAKVETPNVYLMNATKTGLTFGWDAVSGAESYDIYFDLASNLEGGGKPTRVMDSFTGTAVTFTSLTSYLASSDDARVNILGGHVSGYTPEDSWPIGTILDEERVPHSVVVYSLPNGTQFSLTGLTDGLSPATEYVIGVVAHSHMGTAIGETLEGRFTIYTEPPGADNEPVGPEEINSDY